jgi:hypothetical protein
MNAMRTVLRYRSYRQRQRVSWDAVAGILNHTGRRPSPQDVARAMATIRNRIYLRWLERTPARLRTAREYTIVSKECQRAFMYALNMRGQMAPDALGPFLTLPLALRLDNCFAQRRDTG